MLLVPDNIVSHYILTDHYVLLSKSQVRKYGKITVKKCLGLHAGYNEIQEKDKTGRFILLLMSYKQRI